MADSSVAVTAGSGTSIDTRTEATNGDHRQVVVLGDPSVNAGVVGVVNAAPGATDYALEVRQVGLPAAAAEADAISNPTLSQISIFPHTFNGTTWDRFRSIANAQDTTGTGIPAAGLLGQLDDTATGAVTENQFAPVRISSRRALLVEGVASMTKLLVTPDSVALPANQSVNVSQINGVAPVMGNGVTGTGSQRVTIASDNTAFPIIAAGDAANNGAETGNPVKIGGIGNGTQPAAVTAGNRVSGSFDRHGNQFVRAGNQMQSASQWTQIHLPAANTQATKSQGAGAAGVRNVCTSITAVIVATATAPTAVQLNVSLIDGATGGTTYLWRSVLSLPATAGETRGIVVAPCWFVGTAATAMTLEFSAAGGANTVESVSMSGVTITE